MLISRQRFHYWVLGINNQEGSGGVTEWPWKVFRSGSLNRASQINLERIKTKRQRETEELPVPGCRVSFLALSDCHLKTFTLNVSLKYLKFAGVENIPRTDCVGN